MITFPKHGVVVPPELQHATLRKSCGDMVGLDDMPAAEPYARRLGKSYTEAALDRLQEIDRARDRAPPSRVPHCPIATTRIT